MLFLQCCVSPVLLVVGSPVASQTLALAGPGGSEYDDLLGRVAGFLAEVESERARGRASFVEVEENEADLGRFRSFLAKIAARDYFDPRSASGPAQRTSAAPPSWKPSSGRPSWPRTPRSATRRLRRRFLPSQPLRTKTAP